MARDDSTDFEFFDSENEETLAQEALVYESYRSSAPSPEEWRAERKIEILLYQRELERRDAEAHNRAPPTSREYNDELDQLYQSMGTRVFATSAFKKRMLRMSSSTIERRLKALRNLLTIPDIKVTPDRKKTAEERRAEHEARRTQWLAEHNVPTNRSFAQIMAVLEEQEALATAGQPVDPRYSVELRRLAVQAKEREAAEAEAATRVIDNFSAEEYVAWAEQKEHEEYDTALGTLTQLRSGIQLTLEEMRKNPTEEGLDYLITLLNTAEAVAPQGTGIANYPSGSTRTPKPPRPAIDWHEFVFGYRREAAPLPIEEELPMLFERIALGEESSVEQPEGVIEVDTPVAPPQEAPLMAMVPPEGEPAADIVVPVPEATAPLPSPTPPPPPPPPPVEATTVSPPPPVSLEPGTGEDEELVLPPEDESPAPEELVAAIEELELEVEEEGGGGLASGGEDEAASTSAERLLQQSTLPEVLITDALEKAAAKPQTRARLLGIPSPVEMVTQATPAGLTPAEGAQLKDEIKSNYRFINAGGGMAPPTLDESAETLTSLGTTLTMARPATMLLVARQIQDRFTFEKSPALRSIINSGSAFATLVGQSIQDAEQMKFEYGRYFSLGAQGLVTLAVTVPRIVKFIKWLANARRTVGVATAVRNVATGTAVGGVPGFLGGVLYTVGEYLFVSWFANKMQALGEWLTEDYAYTKARQKLASGFFNKQRLVDESLGAMGALSGTRYAGDNLFQFYKDTRANELFGMPLSRMGFDYRTLSTLVQQAAPITPVENLSGFVSSASIMGTLFGGADDPLVMQAYANLSRSGNADVSSITDQFINFFAGLSGDGKLITSQMKLAYDLSEFSKSYGYSAKYNKNAAEQVARVAGFFAHTTIGKIENVSVMNNAVKSLDDVLMAGAVFANPRANELLELSGISQEEAIHGITGDASLLPKVLTGISRKLGITSNSFHEGKIREDVLLNKLYPYLSVSLHMSNETIQAVMVALAAQNEGASVDAVNDSFVKAQKEARDRANVYRTSPNAPKWLETIAKQEVLLSDIIRDNADTMMDITDMMLNTIYATGEYLKIVLGVASMAVTALDKGLTSTDSAGMKFSLTRYLGELDLPILTSAQAGAVVSPDVFRPRIEGRAIGRGVPDYSMWWNREKENLQGISATLVQYINPAMLSRFAPDFLPALMWASDTLGINPVYLLAAIGFETNYSFSPGQRGGTSSAIGLIQFMPDTAARLGTTPEALAAMSASEQMVYVVNYLQKLWDLQPGSSFEDIYFTVFFPAALYNRDDSFVLMGRGGYTAKDGTHYGLESLAANPAFNLNNDDQMTRAEVVEGLRRRIKDKQLFIDVNIDGVNLSGAALAIDQAVRGMMR